MRDDGRRLGAAAAPPARLVLSLCFPFSSPRLRHRRHTTEHVSLNNIDNNNTNNTNNNNNNNTLCGRPPL
jgi:hypothetical protein